MECLELREDIFEVTQNGEWGVITPAGDLVEQNADELRLQLLEMEEDGLSNFRLNFENVEDIDTASLGVLLTFAWQINTENIDGQIEITNASKDISDFFLLTKLDWLIQVASVKYIN